MTYKPGKVDKAIDKIEKLERDYRGKVSEGELLKILNGLSKYDKKDVMKYVKDEEILETDFPNKYIEKLLKY